MCDALTERYAGVINTTNPDLVPTVLFFKGKDCTGDMWPGTGTDFIAKEFTSTSTPLPVGFNPQSIFVPFNYQNIEVENATTTSSIPGPYFIADLTTTLWSSGPSAGQNMVTVPITSLTSESRLNWESQALLSMCMGDVQFIGAFVLSRFLAQGQRCDEFMTSWCSISSNIKSEQCGCFDDLPEILAKSEKLKVDLPVICFGEKCATTRTYKTSSMLSKPCNITICQQTVNTSPGVINEGTDVVFCGGKFFNEQAEIAVPSISPTKGAALSKKGEEAPFYVWIILGVSAILFILLIYIMFSKPLKKGSSILDQLRTIRSINSNKSIKTTTKPNTTSTT